MKASIRKCSRQPFRKAFSRHRAFCRNRGRPLHQQAFQRNPAWSSACCLLPCCPIRRAVQEPYAIRGTSFPLWRWCPRKSSLPFYKALQSGAWRTYRYRKISFRRVLCRLLQLPLQRNRGGSEAGCLRRHRSFLLHPCLRGVRVFQRS